MLRRLAGLIVALDPDRDHVRTVAELSFEAKGLGRRLGVVAPAERLADTPHAMQDDGKPSSNGDLRFIHSDAFIDPA